ncbi:ATP-binding protein [Fodinicola feengrottensis]|uniref:ATP-binding protein n=1 Tax=Fodinicola feengrottensis TaxID=435914 RepID=UPI0013D3283A|nr:ATP-binding protein [Fodinicola feengrottensis]
MDPIRNPYAPGAGQRPPELAGRDRELDQFGVVLERVERRRPERSLVLTGLRGVGKTVLLNALRSAALDRRWGTGKLEARPEVSLRRPLSAALHAAARELAPRHRAPERVEEFLAVLKAFALRSNPADATRRSGTAGSPASTCRPRSAGPTPVTWKSTCWSCSPTPRALAADVGAGVALFIDEMQDLSTVDVSALCAACHELSQNGAPLVVVGAGLPHLPSVLSASKSYSERLFRYVRIDRLDRTAADHALIAPAKREDASWTDEALDAMHEISGGYPYLFRAGVRESGLGPRAGHLTDHG